jgi:signal transduction histidine kinase
VGQSLVRLHWDLHTVRSTILRYGFSVVCTGIALGLAFIGQRMGVQAIESPLFELAIAAVTWFTGVGPALVAVVLSCMAFSYFFSPPFYSFEVSREDLPAFIAFALWATVIAGFLSVRRRIENDLRHARDRLRIEVLRSEHRQREISRLNRELATRAEQFQASNQDLESFAYSVSHDLRAPLRHVLGFSDLLERQASASLDEKSRRYVNTIVESANRMGDLIDDLLSFSRIGRAEARMSSVDLQQLVKEVLEELTQETRGREISWKIGRLPMCWGDRSMLRLVITNLLSNAIKFTSMRSRAEIEIGCVDVDPQLVEVFVKDNGAGFDAQYVHKLFGVFQRLHLSEQFEGTGIGLAIVQRIVSRHGGKVRAEGAVDRGATFYFSLPRAEVGQPTTANTPYTDSRR